MVDDVRLPGGASGGDGPGPESRPAGGSGASAGSSSRPVPEASGVDLARVALRAAKQRARERGTWRQAPSRTPGIRSGARPGGRDPLPLGAAFERLTSERGWEMPLAVGGVTGRWPEVVGPEVAQHCVPERFDEERRSLEVRCDSTAWATQLRLLAPQLLTRLNQELGRGTVTTIRVHGPVGRGRPAGAWRAPGSRGPRDTYG